ncbi:ACP S-malonyltransferase [Streptomyces sp. NPDC023723]|uniref:ACP S-malonyltransferase n=1 Tax=Streptomyces sp. NPDC023723 TaxID=3154323 RepID=UPI0033D8779F
MTAPVHDAVARGRYALLLPGAGSQLPRMAERLCAAFPCAVDVLERAARATGLDLVQLCRAGTPAELGTAEVSHPAIVATGLAAATALRRHLGGRWAPPAVVAGHSLGHFAALVEAGCLDFDDALRLVARRARLMSARTRQRPALMVALGGIPPGRVAEWCADCPAEHGTVVPACFNGPLQTVISGDAAAVRAVARRALAAGDVRVRELPAGVASHSPLMEPVRQALRPALTAVRLSPPAVPLLLNTTGRTTLDAGEVRADLLGQLCAPVRWNDGMRVLAAAGVGTVLDAGPGQVLARYAALHAELRPVALNFMEPLHRAVPLP